MKKTLIFFFIIALPTAIFYYQNKKLQNKINETKETQQFLPKFTASNLKNEIISSESFLHKNKQFFLHIWGTWCGPCQSELPVLLKFAKENEDKDITFYLIATNDDLKSVSKYMTVFSEIPKNVVFLIDTENQIGTILQSTQVPDTYLYSGDGVFINKFIGPQNWNLNYYQKIIMK